MAERPLVPLIIWMVSAVLSLGLLTISQSGAVYDGDEGLHLIAALLVRSGKSPYVDFFYWHQPLYLYVASAWMAIFGESWRSVHILSALSTAASAVLIATFTPGYVQATKGREWWGVVSASLFALNVLVMKWGTIGHNYALCLLLSVAAFRFIVTAVDRKGVVLSVLSGFCAGAAVATSLLVVWLAPILVLWLIAYNRAGRRGSKAACFLMAAVIPFIPLIRLAFEAPRQTLFGLLEHHLFYRMQVENAMTLHLETLLSWVTSPQALLLVLLGGVGVWFVARDSAVDPIARRDIYLCFWLMMGLGTFAAIAHPPARLPYFVLVAPFLAIMASVGVYVLAHRWRRHTPTEFVACVVVGIFALGALPSIYRERLWKSEWTRVEAFGAEVNRVTAAGASFYSSYPFVYFAARRLPPHGLENPWATRMLLSSEMFAVLHVMSGIELTERIRSAQFDTTLLLRDSPRFDPATLDRMYGQAKALDGDYVLRWDPRAAGHAPPW